MKLQDWLYGEVNDSCAICGLSDRRVLAIHHIDGNKRNNAYDNQIVLCHNCHNRHHQNKGLADQQIRDRKRHLIAKTITVYGLNALKIAERNGTGVIAMPFLLYHLVDLGFMTKEETQMEYDQIEVTARFAVTDSGRALLQKWFGARKRTTVGLDSRAHSARGLARHSRQSQRREEGEQR